MLNDTGETVFTSYAGATKILSAGCQNKDQLVVWVETDDSVRGISTFRVCVYGTGWDLPDNPGRFIGTVQDGTGYVWHIYEV